MNQYGLSLYSVSIEDQHSPYTQWVGIAIAKNHTQAKSLVWKAYCDKDSYKNLSARKTTPEELWDDEESWTTMEDLRNALDEAIEPQVF